MAPFFEELIERHHDEIFVCLRRLVGRQRVIANNGTVGGYSGGSGLEAKRWLLQLEGAV